MEKDAGVITARTGLICLLGYPVSHSLSPLMHNAAFQAQGLDMVYLAFSVPPADLETAVAGLKALGVRGANVTVPHKEAVVSLLDDIAPLAARIGAVNTIVNQAGYLVGHNTDAPGFLDALQTVRPQGAEGARFLIAGAGGAARAVVAAVCEAGATAVLIYNRTAERAIALCRAAANWGNAECRAVGREDLATALAEVDVVVNATSVGLQPGVKDPVVPVDNLDSRRHVVMDLVYGTKPTALVAQARSKGVTAVDGLEMLIMQASRSYHL
ncbi:MAG: shikimate dehydrogenase, partial [Thermoleophilia bacterium]|nr:shikimate dehydrogenase [Thermoleophilia bacterium]